MADLIDREVLIRRIASIAKLAKSDPQKALLGRCIYVIQNAPAVDAEPVRKGVWYKYPAGLIACSECEWFGNVDGYGDVYNFCPRCGADMREG